MLLSWSIAGATSSDVIGVEEVIHMDELLGHVQNHVGFFQNWGNVSRSGSMEVLS